MSWWICLLQTSSFSLHKTLIYILELCELLWCFNQLFELSFWWHPFTAEHPLVNKWCNAFSKAVLVKETNSSTSCKTQGWTYFFSNIHIFGWNITFFYSIGYSLLEINSNTSYHELAVLPEALFYEEGQDGHFLQHGKNSYNAFAP